MIEIQGIPSDSFPEVAHLVRPFFDAFAKDGAQSADYFESQILDRKMQLWLAVDHGAIKCACLTEIGTDDLKTCHVSYCTGADHRDWVPLIDQICLWAREQGCARVRATCRPGYQRLLTQHSFKTSHLVMDRVL